MLPSFPLAKEKGEKGMRRSGASTFKRNDVRLAKQDQNIIKKKNRPLLPPTPFPSRPELSFAAAQYNISADLRTSSTHLYCVHIKCIKYITNGKLC